MTGSALLPLSLCSATCEHRRMCVCGVCSIRIAFKHDFGSRWSGGRELYSDRCSDHHINTLLSKHLRECC
jgi:hypothetical protein